MSVNANQFAPTETIIRILGLAIVLALAAAPGLAPAAEPLPSEKSSPPAPASYVSAFEGYRPLIDEPMRPWREANDEMGRLGGHIGHAGSEAGTPARPAPGSSGTPARPGPGNADRAPPGAHSGHQR